MYVTTPVFLILLAVLVTSNGIQTQNITSIKAKDLRTFLSDRTLVTRQINCVLGKGQCDRLGGQLKKAIPEVLHRNCARCTSSQASNARKLINFIQNHYPSAYREVLNKYRKMMGPARNQPTVGRPANPQPSTNATTKSVGVQQTKILTAQSPPRGMTIETADQAKTSSVQTPPKGVTIETAQQSKTSSVQAPEKGTTVETVDPQTKISSVQSLPKGVILEAARQTRVSSP